MHLPRRFTVALSARHAKAGSRFVAGSTVESVCWMLFTVTLYIACLKPAAKNCEWFFEPTSAPNAFWLATRRS